MKKAEILPNPSDSDDDVVDELESQYRDPPVGCVRLRPSSYAGLPSTIFVEYPPELQISRNDASAVEALGKRQLYYNSYWERICIRNAFKRAGFEKSEKHWTALWSKHQNDSQMKELNCLQKVNHFPASWCIGRKDRLARTLSTMKRLHGAAYDFHPDAFVMPRDKETFIRQVAVDGNDSLWIVKPVASSCGRGIRVQSASQVLGNLTKDRRLLVQRYVHNPYLIDGKKFDLRIYVLVSGVDPLRIYIHEEGLTRISTSTYSLKNISNRFAHLTNYSVNKKSKDFKAASFSAADPNSVENEQPSNREGFKWSLRAFREWLSSVESPEIMERTFQQIHELCVKTIIAAEGEITPNLHLAANYRTNCYELFGLDIILDSELRPHLLEVNVSPSLMGSSPLDKMIKGILVSDILHVVGLYPHDTQLLRQFSNSQKEVPSAPSRPASGSRSSSKRPLTKSSGVCSGNPFAFSSVSCLMHEQDGWRRNQNPSALDMSLFATKDSAWLLLLMADDEFSRASSSRFLLAHPQPKTVLSMLALYRSHRFSDHLLARWLLDKEQDPNQALCQIPVRFRADSAASNRLACVALTTASRGPCGMVRALRAVAVEMNDCIEDVP